MVSREDGLFSASLLCIESGAFTEFNKNGISYIRGEFWTSRQRQASRLHEISYRACFKPQLPEFFIKRFTNPGATVYDPFSGRGTTAIQAAIMGRAPIANDINPLGSMLLKPRLSPPLKDAVFKRLDDLGKGGFKDLEAKYADCLDGEDALLTFFHPETLKKIQLLRLLFIDKGKSGELDDVDQWLRMVTINRLTGHSSGFLSVYTLPPNQAVSIESQRKINVKRNQSPPYRDIISILKKKTASLMGDGGFIPPVNTALLITGPAQRTPQIHDDSVDCVVTSPPFMDTINYIQDNWLRCWFAGIDTSSINIDIHRDILSWEAFIREVFLELARVVRPHGMVAFEVGEIRNKEIDLEGNVINAISGLPFHVHGVLINAQAFTKTANCWGVNNNNKGTNSNRIVILEKLI